MEKLADKISEEDMRGWIQAVHADEIDTETLVRDPNLRARLTELCRDFLVKKELVDHTEVTAIKSK